MKRSEGGVYLLENFVSRERCRERIPVKLTKTNKKEIIIIIMTSWRRWSRTDVADRTFARHGHDLLTLVWKIMQMHAGHRGYLSGSNYLLRCSRRKETADDAILTAAVWPRSRPYFYAKCLSVSAPRGQASQLSPFKSLWAPMNHLRQAAEPLLQLLLLLQHPWLLFLLFLFYFSI